MIDISRIDLMRSHLLPERKPRNLSKIKSKVPLSEDKVYLRTIRKMGILRWEVQVPAKASGASAHMVEYEFKMEFDRNMHVAEPSARQVEEQKLEFKRALDQMMLSH